MWIRLTRVEEITPYYDLTNSQKVKTIGEIAGCWQTNQNSTHIDTGHYFNDETNASDKRLEQKIPVDFVKGDYG